MKHLLLTVTALLLCVSATRAGPYEDALAADRRGDEAEAVKLVQAAALQENAKAQVMLSIWYGNGYRVAKDCKESVKLFRLAAAQEHFPAYGGLGWMYLEGKCLAQDYVRAHMWFNLRAAAKPELASDRDMVEKRMTPEQIAEAQKLARECQQRNSKDCD